jgi:hypothetical protein
VAVVITPIRGSNFYLGAAPETIPGTPAAPIYFFRWLGGTKVEIDMKTNTLKEGDATRRNALVIKAGQMVKITLAACLRPDELAYIESIAQGASSDTYTGPTVSTTLSANANAGATSLSVASNTGLTGTGTMALAIGAGTSIEEIVTVNLPVTGSGPYSLTIANSGILKINHTSGNTVKSSASHVLTDQNDGSYTTLEAGFGNLYGAAGTALRIRSCKISSIKRSAKAGEALKHEVEFVGIASTVQSTPATVTLEQHQVYLFTQTTWTLDGSTTGDAPNLESFEIEQKNNLDDTIQTEQLTLAALTYGDLEINAKYTIVWTSASRMYKAYFNDGTTDAQALGLGSLNVLFSQANGLHTLTYNILTLGYLNAQPPVPQEDGKHYKQDVEGTSLPVPLLGAGPNNPYLLQVSTTNTAYAQY